MNVVSLGEILIQLNPINKGPLRHVNLFERHIAGSEGTVMIGMSRLGFSTEFLTAVGDDEFGKCIIATLNSEKVGTNFVRIKPYPTGVYFLQRGYPIPEKTDVLYYRKGSAFSVFSPEDIDPECFKDAVLFHTSGITPALSDSCRLATLRAFELAKEYGIKISFDTNIRRKLLPTAETAMKISDDFIRDAQILITGQGDLEFLFPEQKLEAQIGRLMDLASNAELIVVKMGKEGSMAYKGKDKIYVPAYKVETVDELGAGDAFDATFLSSILLGKSLEESLVYANAAGAIVASSIGDFEASPSWKDLELFISFQKEGERRLIR